MCNMLKGKKALFLIFIFFRLNLRRLSIKLGIQIPYYTDIDEGFMIFHYNCIVINGDAEIGKNFTIRHGVTVGDVNGKTPIIGDNVTIGAGAKVIGGIKVGNNVVIGANAVVNKDVPDNCVVAGVPAKVIKVNNKKVSN
ncbi:serine O-acetyltransferase [Clostridium sp. MSJ-8]|nr:serine O-acetyltransferase [Clostridium sp. MSJ-8]